MSPREKGGRGPLGPRRDEGPCGSPDRDASFALDDWSRLLEDLGSANDLEQALKLAMAALASGSHGIERAVALMPVAETHQLAGRAAMVVGKPGDEASFLRRVRSLTVPLEESGDPVVAAFLAPGAQAGLREVPPASPWFGLGMSSLIAAAVVVGGRSVAVLAAQPVRSVSDADDRAVRALGFAKGLLQAAAERIPLAAELRRRAHEGQLLEEVSGAALSAMNLAEGLNRVTRVACQALNARGSALWVAQPGGALRLEATYGAAAQRERVARGLEKVAQECAARRRPERVERPTADVRLTPETAGLVSSVVCLPLVAYEQTRGVLAVYDLFPRLGGERAGFEPSDLAFLRLLADQAAVIIELAQLFERISRSEKRLEGAHTYRLHLERQAALGETAARVARDVRHPIASITGFARRVHCALAADDPNRDYLEVVVREAERLERLLGEQLQFASLAHARWKVDGLNPVLQEALQEQSEELVRKRVRLLKKLAPDLPELLLDRDKIKQVLANILVNALQAVPAGGRLRVESRRVARYVMVEVAHDGARTAGDAAEQLFVPFSFAKANVPAPGLAVARAIIHGHGGEIRLRSEAEWGTIFSFTLPIQENQDRRAPSGDRRRSGVDRRNRFPAA